MTKSIIFNLSPFNNRADISKAEYIIKKLLGFAVIYMAAAVLGEGIILGGLYAAGYDALHGDMPGGEVAMLLSLYGFAVFAAITLIYRRLVEKKRPEHIGIKKAGKKYFIGIVIAALLLIAIVLFSCLVGAASFERQTQKVSPLSIVVWLGAFMVQGASEEIMCRGFLQGTLQDKLGTRLAVAVSSTVFVGMHLLKTDLMDSKPVFALLGIVNLYLISWLFSALVIRTGSIVAACGLHSFWNFALSILMGSTVSGNHSSSNGLIILRVDNGSILMGGEYGLEAGGMTTVILAIALVILAKRKDNKNGVQ